MGEHADSGASVQADDLIGIDASLLRLKVALMRELGVLEWKGIKLGPAPMAQPEPRSAVEQKADAETAATERKRRKYELELGRKVNDELLASLP